MVWRACNIQNSSLSSDRVIRTLRWWRRMCVCQINKWTKWCLPSSMSGWREAWERSVHCKRPPRRISPSNRNGLNLAIFDSLGRSTFLRRVSISAEKHSVWKALIKCKRVLVISDAVSSPDNWWAGRMFLWSKRPKKWRAATSNRTYTSMRQAKVQELGCVELDEGGLPFLMQKPLRSAHNTRPEFYAIWKTTWHSPTCIQTFQLVRIHSPGHVVCWVVLSWTVLPLCRRRICLYFCDPVTDKCFPSAGITAYPTQKYHRVRP